MVVVGCSHCEDDDVESRRMVTKLYFKMEEYQSKFFRLGS